jgi:hypothetical protein
MQVEKTSVDCMRMSPNACPACSRRIYEYRDGRWTEWICWRCGHYQSDTPAFKAYPHLFHDIVRQNRDYFLEKYAYYGRGIVRNPEPSGQ